MTIDIKNLSFFESRRSPYYIYAPDYRQSSAGIRALHYLCHALNELGYEAYVTPAQITHSPLRTPLLTAGIIERHYLNGATPTAVYPEVVSGNPLGVTNVARWLLNKPGHLGGDSSYGADELIFYFDLSFIPPQMQGDFLRFPTVDRTVFKNRPDFAKSRKGYCYYANKYLVFGGTVDAHLQKTATSLCHDIPRSREQIAAILQQSEALYCYEQSAIILEALACGCPVLIVRTAYWKEHGNGNGYGFGIRPADAPNAIQEASHDLQFESNDAWFEIQEAEAWGRLISFTEKTQSRARALAAQPPEQGDTTRDLWRQPRERRRFFLAPFRNLVRGAFRPSLPDAPPLPSQNPAKEIGASSIPLTPDALALFEQRIPAWTSHPVFHLVIIEDGMPDAALTQTLQSLLQQYYTQVIATVIAARSAPFDLGTGRLEWWETQQNPWQLANEAINQSPADWCTVIRAGDTLAPATFLIIGEYLNQHPDCRVLYCDEDVGNDASRLKPGFNLAQLQANAYMGALLLAQCDLWKSIGGWPALTRGPDELDAALRLTERCNSNEIGHVAGVLFQRGASDTALQPDTPERQVLRTLVVQEHLNRQGINAVAEDGLLPGHVHVRYALDHPPLVSIIIPTRNRSASLETCLQSLVNPTEYPAFEIIVVDNGSDNQTTCAYLDGLARLGSEQIRVLPLADTFNLAALYNFGARYARGEFLLMLHDDVSAMHRDWLANMVSICAQDKVGAVGGRLMLPDGTLQQGWLIPFKAGITEQPFHAWPLDAPDSQRHLNTDQEVPAIGSACMLIKRTAFDSIGGFDAERFSEYFSDIDFCLSLRRAGYKVVWTPYATLLHNSDNSMWGDKTANNALFAKWRQTLVNDPLVNPYWSTGSDIIKPEEDPCFLPDIISWHPLPCVYALPVDQDGAGHYRVIQPANEAHIEGLTRSRIGAGYPFPAMMAKIETDVVFCQKQLEDRQADILQNYRRLLNCKIVMDFDDNLTKVSDKNIHKKTLHKDMKARLRRMGTMVDRITVSTEPLVAEFKHYHDDVRMIPNALKRSQWEHLKSHRRTSNKPRVGWAGGVSHQGDLEIVRDVIRSLADEVDWVFLGMWLRDTVPFVREHHDGAKFDLYPAKLASLNLDLAIAPLEINHFNECKSHLKLLEYGVLGIPVIATDIVPYQSGFPMTLVKNRHQEWVKSIREHINDLDVTAQRGDALRKHILDNWMLDKQLPTWLSAWSQW